ncbi:MAG: hypothetical protein GF419_01515 [Ignavibacteriales bacterium]|nr:hypothetical protein [Ignavibacteriales bacterium]
MKTGQVFWGVFLVALGALYFIENAIEPSWNAGQFVHIWPAALVGLGGAMIASADLVKAIFAGVAGLALGAALFGFTVKPSAAFGEWGDEDCGDWDEADIEFVADHLVEPYEGDVEEMTVRVSGGAMQFSVDADTSALFRISSVDDAPFFKTKFEKDDDEAELYLQPQRGVFDWDDESARKNRLSLHPAPLYDFVVEVGASEVNYNLAELRVRDFRMETGAASATITFGEPIEKGTTAKIACGAAEIVVRVPVEAGVELSFDGALVDMDYGDLEEKGDGEYRSANFYETDRRFEIEFDGGAASFKIERY